MSLLKLPLLLLFLPTNFAQYNQNRPPYDQQYGGNNGNGNQQQTQYGDGNANQQQPQYGGGGGNGNNNRFQPSLPPPYGGTNANQQDNTNCCQDYCYAEDENAYANFGTKTAYEIVYGKQSNQHRVADCTPIQFWSINRHGTRYPSHRTIQRLRELTKIRDEILRNYEERRSYPDRGRLCVPDYQLIRNWHWNESVTDNRANELTQQGIDDLKYLARRYHSRFEQIFREPYSERVYNFQYTDTDRTHDSYQAFIDGLFLDNSYLVHANVHTDNRLLQPTKSCQRWQHEVNENTQTFDEYERFKQQQIYQEMVRDVFRRLGFRYTLNDTIIEDMYDMCRYEKAWNLHQKSPWCIVFNKDQLKILEYSEDLKYYYKAGYGNGLNKKIGCTPVKDLYDKFQRTINGETADGGNTNKVTVYFTHSAAILTFLTALGIAEDYQPLKADNYHQQKNRQWRTSQIDPFAANFAAALYECRTGERHRIMFFLNEAPVNYPDCSVGLCNWSTIKRKFENIAEQCNLDFCDQNHTNRLVTNTKLFYVVASIILLYWRNLL